MATRLKRSEESGDHEWLVSDPGNEKSGLNVATVVHPDGDGKPNIVEVQVYDHDAPKDRTWTIAIIDRRGVGNFVLSGELQRKTRDEAMRQLGIASP